MTDFINNIAVDLDIYNKWPGAIEDCSIMYVGPKNNYLHHIFLIKEKDGFPAKNIIISDSLPFIPEILARLSFYIEENKDAPVTNLFVNEELRSQGVGKFLCIISRTWVAENLDAKIYSPENERSPEVQNILIDIAIEYNEDSIKIMTLDGEYKTIDEITDLEKELGI